MRMLIVWRGYRRRCSPASDDDGEGAKGGGIAQEEYTADGGEKSQEGEKTKGKIRQDICETAQSLGCTSCGMDIG